MTRSLVFVLSFALLGAHARGPLDSTLGLFWCVLAWLYGVVVGFLLRFITAGRRSRDPYLRHDDLRVAFGGLLIMIAYTVFLELMTSAVYHEPLRVGILWSALFPPIVAWGMAIGFGAHRAATGTFPPVTPIADE